MKTYIKTGLGLMLLTTSFFLSSCVKEELLVDGNSFKAGVPVNITLNATGALVTDVGDPEDAVISEFRVLMYDTGNGELAFNIPITEIPTAGKPARINILTGTYDFVFIANEASDALLEDKLTAADNADIDTFAKLNELTIARAAYDDELNIPMVTLFENVDVRDDNLLTLNTSGSIIDGTWSVSMQRVAIRLKIAVTMTEYQYGTWPSKAIKIGNVPSQTYVLPNKDNLAFQNDTPDSFTASTTALADDGFIAPADSEGNRTVVFNRLILPELFLSPENNGADDDENAMVMSMDFTGGKTKSGLVKVPDDDPLRYSLPRNTYLSMAATVKEDAIVITAVVLPWGDADRDITFDGQYTLTVDKTDFYFSPYSNVPQPIHVTTDYPTGWTIENLSTNPIPSWLNVPTPNDNSVSVQENMDGVKRGYDFVIVAGNLRKTIHVVQYPYAEKIADSKSTPLEHIYAGAFWRADQQGERLIYMPQTNRYNDGKWNATVIEGEDWIHLDTLPSQDPNVGWRTDVTPNETAVIFGNDNDFEQNYIVTGNDKTVAGEMSAANPDIYFRIGLNGMYAATDYAPARYGVVLVSYNNGTEFQRIWIRQGEGADYVMRNGDPVGGTTGLASRTEARQFSPFNLTAARLNEPVRATYSPTADTDAGANNPAISTEYPSQVGAMWQWASVANPRVAWDSYSPSVSGFAADDAEYVVRWDQLYTAHETCPVGYRRPTDGPVDKAFYSYLFAQLQQSELRQSLFENPDLSVAGRFANTNYVAGYYADGFFDRLSIKKDPSGSTDAVSIDNGNMANSGGVFFNPMTKASLFLSVIGYRNGDFAGGPLGYAPNDEHYWTSSANGIGAAWAFRGYPRMASGLAVRCVRDDNMVPPAPLPSDPNMVTDDERPLNFMPYVGAFWKKDQTGERLIRILRPENGGADGDWTAQVLVGADWIVIDDKPTTDPNVGWLPRPDTDPREDTGNELDCDYGNDSDFDALHPVTGGIVPWVKGRIDGNDDDIYFRIGLKSKWSDQPGYDPVTAPARYGIVLLTYKDNSLTHRIWIRQGEEPDFLMRNTADAPEDAPQKGPMVDNGYTRDKAVKFSPYNLTAANLDQQVGVNGAGPNPGVFTDYPSQAGALFQWAQPSDGTGLRYAWNQHINAIPGNWSTTVTDGSVYWTPEIAAINETCPAGYHRPSDGQIGVASETNFSANTDLTFAEMRQSLYLNPPPVNSDAYDPNVTLSGYYADGFYDRRMMFYPQGQNYKNIINSAVSFRNKDVAYMGAVIFNPNNFASLFFPYTGQRGTNGGFGYGGGSAWYASTTATKYSTEVCMFFYVAPNWTDLNLFGQPQNKGLAYSIRCVKN